MFKIKKFLTLSALTLVTLLALPAAAQTFIGAQNFSGNPALAFCGMGATNVAINDAGGTFRSNLTYFVASAKGLGVPRIQSMVFLNDTTDGQGGFIQAYQTTGFANITNAGAVATNALFIDSTNGITSNSVIVVQSVLNDTYQRCVVTNNPTATQINVNPTLLFAVTNGDRVFIEVKGSILPGGAGVGTNYFASGGILYGRAGFPLLVEAQFSNAAVFKIVAGDYLPNRDR